MFWHHLHAFRRLMRHAPSELFIPPRCSVRGRGARRPCLFCDTQLIRDWTANLPELASCSVGPTCRSESSCMPGSAWRVRMSKTPRRMAVIFVKTTLATVRSPASPLAQPHPARSPAPRAPIAPRDAPTTNTARALANRPRRRAFQLDTPVRAPRGPLSPAEPEPIHSDE